jgi:hypothetical protein
MIRYIATSNSFRVPIVKSEGAETTTLPDVNVASTDFQSTGRVISTSPSGWIYLPLTSEVDERVVPDWLNDVIGIRNNDINPKIQNKIAREWLLMK